jgi:protein-disulfide isomerase
MSAKDQKVTRSQQREEAREKARQIREQHKKTEKARQIGFVGGIVTAILILGGLMGWAIVSSGPTEIAKPTNMSFDNGIRIGTNLEAFTATNEPTTEDVPIIKIYVDYQCPFCKNFEQFNAPLIESKVAAGEWIVEYHPISFLDGGGSPNEFSSRAANAAVCVAEFSPNNFLSMSNKIMSSQPEEATAGPSDSELAGFAEQVGVANFDKVKRCINAKSFDKWISTTTSDTLGAVVPGTDLVVDSTPFVVLNGLRYSGTAEEMANPARFQQWVDSVWAQN